MDSFLEEIKKSAERYLIRTGTEADVISNQNQRENRLGHLAKRTSTKVRRAGIC